MRKFIFLVILICMATSGWAEEDVSGKTQIRVGHTEPGGTKKLYVTSRYTIDEETNIVQQALDVFRKKAESSSLYEKKFRIYDTLDPDNQAFLSFMTNDENAGIVFSG